SGNPNPLAHRSRRALDALDSAGARAVDAAASCGVPNPSPRLAYHAALYRSRNLLRHRIPMSAIDRDGSGVVDGLGYVADNVAGPSLLLGDHDRIVDHALVSLVYRLHDRIVDHALPSLVNRLADGVVDHLFVGLV